MKIKLLKITQIAKDALSRIKITMTNGNVNTLTAIQYGNNGDDSPPIKNSIAAYSDTEMDGKAICLGIMSSNAKAEPGEKRLYCTDENGVFKCVVWLRNDGTMLQGDSDIPSDYTNFSVKYNELKLEYDKTKTYLTTLKTATQAALVSLDAVVPGVSATFTATMSTQVVGDISSSKNSKIKYK